MSAAAPHAALLDTLARAPRLTAPAEIALKAAVVLTLWTDRARSRKHLAGLDAHLLRDVGLDRAEAAREAARPFWQG
ncbi:MULTISPECIES: DUF1127 domain-containing protein [unclassified Roseivivax]|uniref:DUF1127 domain-containing protein n=1 Tax=Roseivivax sp. GX 12232 TaxID=2900547 RepID=UPI001E288F7D|nr:DUF1127 domain-containing protein [Roseivivax sp. GX 12232]MCE0504535.1 DUF1127 domain-containing protein [Roseivivax sp. GX 12232]